MFDENAVVSKPQNLANARYKLSLNGIRLFNLIFTKITPSDYVLRGESVRVEVTTSEWKEWFDLKSPSASLKAGIQNLYSSYFVFEKEPDKKYRMLKSYDYNDGHLGLDISPDFLAECVRND